MSDLTGRRILVTGGSSGIGAATARACAARGAKVAVIGRRMQPLVSLAAEVGGYAFPADLTDADATRQAVSGAADALGRIDALVNNAGVMRPSLVGEGRFDDWRTMIDVNILGLLTATHAALPFLRRAHRGDIVNVGSLSGRRVPNPAAGVYAATKHAVHAISESLRQELLEDGIRVTVVAPGIVDTELVESSDHEAAARLRQMAAEVGLPPSDVGSAIADTLALPPHVLVRELTLSATAQAS